LVCTMAGCGPDVINVSTNKDPSFTREPKRLSIVNAIGKELGPYTETYQTALEQKLKNCGVTPDIINRTPQAPSLSLDNNEVNHENEVDARRIQQFAPDSLLRVSQTQYVSASGAGSGIVSITYALELDDMAMHHAVWKAQLTLQPRSGQMGVHEGNDGGTLLAIQVIAALQKDQILRSCRAA
jgi:hypothetical protein